MVHKLKIYPNYFESVSDGVKSFEVRKDDRNFKIGDKLILREWKYELIESHDSGEEEWGQPHYTGRKIEKEITYILKGGSYGTKGSGLRKGWVILGIK